MNESHHLNCNRDLSFFFFRIMLWITILLPSGTIYGYNIKSIIIILIFASYITRGVIKVKKITAAALTLPFFVVLLSSAQGFINNVNSQSIFSEGAAIILNAIIIFFGINIINDSKERTAILLKDVVATSALYSLLKIAIVILAYTEIIPIDSIQENISNIFGYSFITLNFCGISRIHLPQDSFLILSIIIIAIKASNNLNMLNKILLGFIFLGLIISYSRLQYASLIIISLLISIKNILDNNTSLTKKNLKILAVISIYILGIIFFKEFIYERFTGSYAVQSDDERIIMAKGLLDMFYQKPVLGAGLGASIPGYIRFPSVPWYYELQWLHLLAQLGAILFISIVVIALYPIYICIINHEAYTLLIPLSGYIIWLGTNYYNGFMLTSTGGFIFLNYYILLSQNKSFKNNIWKCINSQK